MSLSDALLGLLCLAAYPAGLWLYVRHNRKKNQDDH